MIYEICGILMTAGGILTIKGRIFQSICCYTASNILFLAATLLAQNWSGSISLAIGITLGVIAAHKMMSGKMNKNLDETPENVAQ